MTILSIKNRTVVLIALIIALLVWQYNDRIEIVSNNSEVANQAASVDLIAEPDKVIQSSGSDLTKEGLSTVKHKPDVWDQVTTLAGTPADRAELAKWEMGRGYKDKSNGYESYDEATLKKLVDAGDIQAMHRLAEIYRDDDHIMEFGFEAAKDLYTKAAIYGSTEAFSRLGSIDWTLVYDKLKGDDPMRHQAALEILATYNVAALRGDQWPNLAAADTFKSINKIKLSVEDEAFIESRAKEIYAELQGKRYELGLGEFDNSVPDSVRRFFDELNSQQ